MTETAETSTIQTTEDVTSQEVTETNDTVETTTSQETETNDTTSEANETDETKAEQTKETQTIDYEKQYKELQAAYTKGQQEIAELKKQVPQQPQIVNEQGQVNPQFEQAFYFNLNQGELREYQNLAMQLEDANDRDAAIQQLNQANAYLSNGNIQGFNACMNEAKMLFNPAHIERINGLKMQALANKNAYLGQAMQELRMQAGANLEAKLQTNETIWKLVNPDSPDYNEGVFNAVCDYFNSYGDVDVDELIGIMNTFKEIGVREYQANLEAQKTAAMNKSKAGISSGEGVAIQSGDPTDLNSEAYWDKFYNRN